MKAPVEMRLLTYNILKGGQMREEEIVEVIQSVAPDVVVVQEVLRVEHFRQIAMALGMSPYLAHSKAVYRYGLAYLVGYRFWAYIRFICGLCGLAACGQPSSLRTDTP